VSITRAEIQLFSVVRMAVCGNRRSCGAIGLRGLGLGGRMASWLS
jgi:hypothetical protein